MVIIAIVAIIRREDNPCGLLQQFAEISSPEMLSDLILTFHNWTPNESVLRVDACLSLVKCKR